MRMPRWAGRRGLGVFLLGHFSAFLFGVVFQDDYQAFPCKYLRTPTRLSVIFDDRDRFSEILLCTWQKRENEGLLKRF